MGLGLSIFLTDEPIAPAEMGRLAEQRGSDSLWLLEHTHMPLDHTPYPRRGDVPRQYLRTLDPFVALTAVAAATETLLLGFGICLIT